MEQFKINLSNHQLRLKRKIKFECLYFKKYHKISKKYFFINIKSCWWFNEINMLSVIIYSRE